MWLRCEPFRRLFLRVRHFRILFFSVPLALLASLAQAQDEPDDSRRGSRIIDDTTKQIYGPTTSRYFYEEDVFYNQPVYFFIDTVIRNFHRFTPVQQNDNLYQDLGNIGTDARPIYYQVPRYTGANPGINVYDLYWDARKIRYFDTHSPYSNMQLGLGGKGRSMTKIVYARNINPRWNFGFNYRTLFVDKQVQRQGKGDRNVRSVYYDFFTNFQSKDSTYRLFFNLARARHRVFEYGGVIVDDDYTLSDFFIDEIRPWLTAAESRELRTGQHLYHQYEVGRALQVYHKLDHLRQGNQFYDNMGTEPEEYFDYTEIDSTEVHDAVKFDALRNEAGIKGSLLKLFYNGYYAVRNYSMQYKFLDTDTMHVSTKGAEHYLGGRMALQLDSLMQLRGWLEVQDNGNFRIEGTLRSKWLEVSLKQNKYAPGFVQQAYRGSHDVWNNDFANIDVTQLNGYIHYRSKVLKFSPGLTFSRIHNYVYFAEDTAREQQVLPAQATDNVIASPELRFALTFFKHITLRGRGIYTILLENSGDAIRVPELFVNGQISYENIFFKGNLELHAGVDIHWKSAYYAPGFDPAIQQFYVQDRFESPAFPLIDIFLNAKIKRGRIFLKYHNPVQRFTKEGYFPTPFYPGQATIVDFGFDWSFYD